MKGRTCGELMRRVASRLYTAVLPAVYILECADGTYYTGSTRGLAQRFDQHKLGFGANYTRKRLPVKLVWYSEFERVDEAFRWEKRIQGWSRAKKQLPIEERYDEMPGWSARQRRGRVDAGDDSGS